MEGTEVLDCRAFSIKTILSELHAGMSCGSFHASDCKIVHKQLLFCLYAM